MDAGTDGLHGTAPVHRKHCSGGQPSLFPVKIFHQYPHAALSPFIDRLWGWESVSPEPVRLPTLLPGTGAELYVHYGEPFRIETRGGPPAAVDRGHLFCIRNTPIPLSPASGIGFVAVRFKIGMLRRFTNLPANELADSRLCVHDLWGVAGTRLAQQLSGAAGHRERIALLQRFLLRHLRTESEDLPVEQAMGLLYRQGTALSIDALAGGANLGRRQFERRWQKFSGQSPSEVKGLIRFQRAVRQLMIIPSAGVADTALACGYFDQAHFIHDFRRRVGMAPGHYLRLARDKTHFYNTPLR
ncbi:helix-turn-helix domain-containing protein [Herbaspirillum sp.]|uniref:AraC family transcriptional regulator n=1 Tax=Herbaspirillum sp. TaxID=1890675 RepID=UPI001B11ADF2|nr:helix-turn-helix domain-containing protein [Herbaspirillum sp.]MBO9537207.1 AraC family transcriptional regulator [Herbaspirillum sp.]